MTAGRMSSRSRPIPEWAEPIIALGENVQQGRCDDCGLHVWLWLCVRYDDDGERHQPSRSTCRGCTGTCCTGIGSEPCMCPDEEDDDA